MFGARYEDKKWYLCIRRGITIKGTAFPYPDGKWQEFVFKSQKQAKACADELNDKFWNAYDDNDRKSRRIPDIAQQMIECIKRHLGTVALEETF
jgi:ArsR family metal-binding transcriptional regulator